MMTATDAYLWRGERQEREAREQQEWAHRHALHDPEAREVHDWDLCPLCDRITSEKRFPGIATMPDLSPRMKRRRVNKAGQRERKAQRRREHRREQRS